MGASWAAGVGGEYVLAYWKTVRANIDYHYARAHYPGAGIIGIKVWIYKGEVN